MEPQAAQRTIEEIIAADDVKFRTLKQRAEYVDYARGLSFNERDDTRRAEKLAQWEAGTAEHAEVFVSADYYATSIAPRIQALTDDPEAFARVSELSVLALEHIGVYLLTEGKDRKLPVASFFEQFFAGLHRESPETIAAFAKIEASRMQGLFPMMTTTAMDFNAWIAECRASPFAEHLPELIDIGGGEHHPNAIFAVPFWKQALPTLEQLTVRGHPELIPTYLTIARATLQRHGRFNVSKPDTADRIIALRECGAHLDAGVRLYEALADNILSESANDVARIVQEIRVLAAQRSGDEVAALLTEATTLANARVYPLPYLNAVRGDTAYAERGRMREVALAVASTAPSGARRYLERTYEPERKEITLIKPTSATVQRFAARTEQVYQDRLQRYAREVTEGRGEGRKAVALKEELGEFHVRMMNCYATFIEAFGRGIGRAGFVNDPIDRPYLKGEFRLPDTTIGGTVDGLVFPL